MSDLPQGWAEAIGGDVFEYIRGVTYKKQQARDTHEEGLAGILRATNIQDGSLDKNDLVYVPSELVSEKQTLRLGDQLIASSSGSKSVVGKAAPVSNEIAGLSFGAFCAVARPRSDEIQNWIRVFFQSPEYRQFVNDTAMGNNINNLRSSDLIAIGIPFPPIPEQRRIVAKVDGLTARTARARKELDRIPTLIARYKQRLLALAYQGKLTAGFRIQHGLPPAQQMPLARLCTTITDGDHQAPPRAEEGVPFITISAMNDGEIELNKASRFVPQSYFDNLKKSRQAEPGDVLFSVTGSFGIPALVKESHPFVFQRHIAILKPDTQNTSGPFLRFMLEAPDIKAQGIAVATGSAQLTVSLKGLRNFVVPLPSHQEQAEIVRRIETAFGWLDRIAADHAAAARLLPKLDAAILGKAFRGELVPQDPNDEPARLLLERVNAERDAAPNKGRRKNQKFVGKGISVTVEVGTPSLTINRAASSKGRTMSKSRHDKDVWHKPYLANLLRDDKASDTQSLFKVSKLAVADFYKQLAWEVESNLISDDPEDRPSLHRWI